jgi:hypothetical protein
MHSICKVHSALSAAYRINTKLWSLLFMNKSYLHQEF